MYMYAYLLLLKEISFGMTIFVNSVYKYVCKNWTVVDTLYLNSLNPNLEVINRQVPIMWSVQIEFFCAMNLFYQFKCKKCIYIYVYTKLWQNYTRLHEWSNKMSGSMSNFCLINTQCLALVVRRLDNAIHWIKLYLVDNTICFAITYPLDRNLSFG